MRILVVEDEKDMNRIIVRGLESEGYLVDSCFDGESALDYMCIAEYDGVILDIMIPKKDGFTVVKEARSRGIHTPILLLSAQGNVDYIVRGLDLGADDYMVKPFDFRELFARVRLITRKKADTHENVYSCGELVVNCNDCSVKRGEKEIELSPKEYAVLLYLMRNQNMVVTREQIEENIWGIDHSGNSNLIDVYIRYLRKKIDDGFEVKMIQTIRGVGYLLKEK